MPHFRWSSTGTLRAQEEDYEIAVTLDALLHWASRTGRPESAERRAERDALLGRLDVIALPEAPIGPLPVPAGRLYGP